MVITYTRIAANVQAVSRFCVNLMGVKKITWQMNDPIFCWIELVIIDEVP